MEIRLLLHIMMFNCSFIESPLVAGRGTSQNGGHLWMGRRGHWENPNFLNHMATTWAFLDFCCKAGLGSTGDMMGIPQLVNKCVYDSARSKVGWILNSTELGANNPCGNSLSLGLFFSGVQSGYYFSRLVPIFLRYQRLLGEILC